MSFLASARLPLGAALLAVLLALPSVGADLAADDWFHRAHLDPAGPILAHPRGPLLDLFRFFPEDPGTIVDMRDRGLLPWWVDPAIRGGFFRPLAAATHLFDWQVFGEALALHHLHSLAWLALAVLAAAALFRAWLGGRAAALATLAFAVDDAHAWPAAWLANRNALLALTFGLVAAAAHRHARSGRPGARLLAPLAFGAALCSAEAGAATAALLVALEVGPGPGRAMLARLAPYVGVGLVWLGVWRLGGYGISGSGLYVDPVRSPLRFLSLLPERLGALSAAAWLNAPVDFWVLLPERVTPLLGVGLGALTAAVVAWVAGATLRDPATGEPARQALVLSVAGLLAPVAAFPMERVTLFGGVGVCALVGLVTDTAMRDGWTRWRDRLLAAWHLPVAALLYAAKAAGVPLALGRLGDVVNAVPDDPAVATKDLIIVSGLEIATSYVPLARDLQGLPRPRRLAVLAPAASRVVVTRTGVDELRLDAPDGTFRHAVERLCRESPIPTGTEVDTALASVRVLEADDQGYPTSLRVRLPAPADDPRFLWLAPRSGALVPWAPPALGASVEVEAFLPLPW